MVGILSLLLRGLRPLSLRLLIVLLELSHHLQQLLLLLQEGVHLRAELVDGLLKGGGGTSPYVC